MVTIPEMRKLSLYLDTSILGGYFDDEFKGSTRKLWEAMKKGIYDFVASEIVMEEVQNAPKEVKALFYDTFSEENVLEFTPEMHSLANLYLEHKVVTERYKDDARHVAACTVAKVDHLVSWNFKHLVNVHRESGFNGVNLLQEYPSMSIISPREVIYGIEKEKEV